MSCCRTLGLKRLLGAGLATLALTAWLPAFAQSDVDPLESVNRAVFSFNESLDQAIIKPAARAYVAHVPDLVRLSLHNFIYNLVDPLSGVNNLLQGKPVKAASDFGRFLLNTFLTFGIGDIATDLGLERSNEDFGQTLGVWGVGSGPYLVLPVLGPSSVRDGLGRVLDIRSDLSREIKSGSEFAVFTAARIIDFRAGLLPMDRMIEGAALDRYSFIRNSYLQRRQSLINDGAPTQPSKE